jgi:hypothetical protein
MMGQAVLVGSAVPACPAWHGVFCSSPAPAPPISQYQPLSSPPLQAEEMDQAPPQPPARTDQPAIEVVAGSFAWQKGAEPQLRNVSLSVPRGALVIVVGSGGRRLAAGTAIDLSANTACAAMVLPPPDHHHPTSNHRLAPSLASHCSPALSPCPAVGAGKSSLLSAMLGEMVAVSGTVAVRGSTAFTQQDPWIQVQLHGDGFAIVLPAGVAGALLLCAHDVLHCGPGAASAVRAMLCKGGAVPNAKEAV